MRVFTLLLACSLFLTPGLAPAPAWAGPKSVLEDSVAKVLRPVVGTQYSLAQVREFFSIKFTDLNNDGETEALAQAQTWGDFCVKGQCRFFVLRLAQGEWTIMLDATSQGRAKLLSTSSEGFPDVRTDLVLSATNSTATIHKAKGGTYVKATCIEIAIPPKKKTKKGGKTTQTGGKAVEKVVPCQ